MKYRLSQHDITNLLKIEKVTDKQNYIQDLGIEYFVKSHGNLVCTWATATGKTILAVKIIKKLLEKNPDFIIDIVIPFDTLKKQWEKHFDNPNVKVFILKTYNKLNRKPFLLVVDECHLGVSNIESKEANNLLDFGAKYKLFLSATLKKTQIQFLKSKGIENEFYIPLEESILLKIVPKLKIINIPVDFTEAEKEKYSKAIFNEAKCKAFFSRYSIENIPDSESSLPETEDPKITKIMYYMWLRARNSRVHTIYNATNKVQTLKEINDLLQHRKIIYITTTQKNADIIKTQLKVTAYHSGIKPKIAEKNLDDFYNNETTKIASVMKLIAGFDDACTDTLVRSSYFSAKAGTVQSLGK